MSEKNLEPDKVQRKRDQAMVSAEIAMKRAAKKLGKKRADWGLVLLFGKMAVLLKSS